MKNSIDGGNKVFTGFNSIFDIDNIRELRLANGFASVASTGKKNNE